MKFNPNKKPTYNVYKPCKSFHMKYILGKSQTKDKELKIVVKDIPEGTTHCSFTSVYETKEVTFLEIIDHDNPNYEEEYKQFLADREFYIQQVKEWEIQKLKWYAEQEEQKLIQEKELYEKLKQKFEA